MQKFTTLVVASALFAVPIVGRTQEQPSGNASPARDTVSANVPPTSPGGKADKPGKGEKAEVAPRNWFGSELSFTRWSSVTGDWAGTRTFFADHGIDFSLAYTHDVSSNVSGGAKSGSALRSLFMGSVTVDFGTLAGLPGTKAALSYGHQGGANGSEVVGDIQAFSNIDAAPFSHIYEAWIEQSVAKGFLRVKFGQVDANTEFAVVGPAADFINASAGFSPTILGLPTYPQPKMSLNVFVQPVSWLSIGGGSFAGTFDAADDERGTVKDQFTIGEVKASWEALSVLGAGKVAYGHWRHSGLAERFDGGLQKGADGWWATLEQRLTGDEASDEKPASGVQFFAKYGSAPGMLSIFQQHAMVGLLFDGGFRSGSDDALGVAMTHVDLSNVADAGTPLDETSFEFFYKVKLFGFAAVRPNVQYIVHPSGDPSRRNALVATLRTSISF